MLFLGLMVALIASICVLCASFSKSMSIYAKMYVNCYGVSALIISAVNCGIGGIEGNRFDLRAGICSI